jgi:hypothetical protein
MAQIVLDGVGGFRVAEQYVHFGVVDGPTVEAVRFSAATALSAAQTLQPAFDPDHVLVGA